MIREIVNIDEDLCNGCGDCIPNCHEGALQIIDNKAVLVSDLMCDGLGACIGHCPTGALSIEKREAVEYDEVAVMEGMVKKGKNVVTAHLKHLKDHNEKEFLRQGVKYLWEHKDELSFNPAEVIEKVHNIQPVSAEFRAAPRVVVAPAAAHHHGQGGCPGSRSAEILRPEKKEVSETIDQPSELSQWPVQLHLINPSASYFQGADLLIAADCTAFAAGNFHSKYLKGKKLVIACPKLDQGMEIYYDKIKHLIEKSAVKSITVLRMEVPCCGGLSRMVNLAVQETGSRVSVEEVVLKIQ